MAILWFDSFGHLPTDSSLRTSALQVDYTTTGVEYSTTTGPDGRPVLSFTGPNRSIRRDVSSGADKWVHCLLRGAGPYTSTANNRVFLRFYEGATQHISVRPNSDGSISVMRGDGGGTELGSTAAGVLSAGVWHAVGVAVSIHDSTGTVRVVVDGVEVLSLTGQDTRNGGTSGAINGVLIGHTGNAGTTTLFRHLVIGDTTGSAPLNELPAFLMTDYLPVDGSGNDDDWTPNASTNHSRVSERHPDDDSTYNESGTVGHKDSFATENLPANVDTILAMRAVVRDRKTGAGASDIETYLRIGSNEYVQHEIAQSESYVHRLGPIRTLSPATTDPWEVAEVNGMEVGYEKIT